MIGWGMGGLEHGQTEMFRQPVQEYRRLAEEQAALLRVAGLVAHGAPPPEVFTAVVTELGRLLQVSHTSLMRYDCDGMMTVVAAWGALGEAGVHPPVGSRWSVEGDSVAGLVVRTGKPARKTSYENASSDLARFAKSQGVGSGVAGPIVVEGRLWGVTLALYRAGESPPEHTEERLLRFNELVAAAIANTDSRAELVASRARVVAAADEARRRIERDLHDGAQQRLVSLALNLLQAQAEVPVGHSSLKEQLSRSVRDLRDILDDLQKISRGIHPVILSQRGLGPALGMLARRSAVRVKLSVHDHRRLAERVEVAVYYLVSEALTNAAKHAHASLVNVDLRVEDGIVRLSIDDDGIGGADARAGSGLTGLRDRVEAFGGRIQIISPTGQGTSLHVEIPVEGDCF
jgi:signal transduction histidine kinase